MRIVPTLHGLLRVALIGLAVVTGRPARASDVNNVVFIPAGPNKIVKGSAGVDYTVTFDGTVNMTDGGHVIFNITEADLALNFDDPLLKVDFTPNTPLAQGTNFNVFCAFRLDCDAACRLGGVNVSQLTVIVGGAPVPGTFAAPAFINPEIEPDYQVVIEDVQDTQNHGLMIVECVTAIPTMQQWHLALTILMLLSGGAALLRLSAGRAQLAGASTTLEANLFDRQSFVRALGWATALMVATWCATFLLAGEITTADLVYGSLAILVAAYPLHLLWPKRSPS